MAKKMAKKSLPWVMIIGLIISIVFGLNFGLLGVRADDANTSVSVGNAPPAWAHNDNCDGPYPCEHPASWDGGNTPTPPSGPTNSGSNVTFKATATDPNADNWKLLVCKTAGLSGVNCDGGDSDRWCQSNYVASGNEASCNYETSDADAQSKAWYAYACDASTCSDFSQGNTPEDNASPYKVNRAPSFGGINDPGSFDPGENVTWTTTDTSDPDNDGFQDNVRLIVCKTTGLNGDDCDGGESDRWCRSNYVASNPSCTYSIPAVNPHGTYNAYVYVVDWHHFGSVDVLQGSNKDFAVNDVTPIVSSVTLSDTDGEGDLVLLNEEGVTSGFMVTGTVTDYNSCVDINSVVASVYRSGIGWANCQDGDSNNNNCYPLLECTPDAGTCTGSNDPSATYTCTFGIQYHADPTDNPLPEGTPWTAENWKATMKASDESNSGNAETAVGREMLSFLMIGLGSNNINYGTLAPGQANTSDITVTIKATGNVALDAYYYGTSMTASGRPDITADYQHYDLTGGKAWDSMDYVLSDTETERELNCKKTTLTNTPETKNTYYRIKIPDAQPADDYSGQNTFGAVVGELAQW